MCHCCVGALRDQFHDETTPDEEAGTYSIRFGNAYHAQHWKDHNVKSVAIRFEGDDPRLVLRYTVTTPDETSDSTLALKTVEMGVTRFSP